MKVHTQYAVKLFAVILCVVKLGGYNHVKKTCCFFSKSVIKNDESFSNEILSNM